MTDKVAHVSSDGDEYTWSLEGKLRGEDQILLYCARAHMDDGVKDHTRSLLQFSLDWEYLIRQARQQGLLSFMAYHINQHFTELVPPEILERLRNFYRANALRNLFLTQELLRLLDVFQLHGIHAMPYKGPALAAFVYGDIGLREVCDLDILVQSHDVLKAKDLLITAGYKPKFPLASGQEAIHLQMHWEYSFINEQTDTLIELHWNITARRMAIAFNIDQLWERSQELSFCGHRILAPSHEDLLMMLCIHGVKHNWMRLEWICGLSELIRTCDRIEWTQVLTEAKEMGTQRVLFLGLVLAHGLLSVQLPSKVMAQILSDPVVAPLSQYVRHQIFTQPNERGKEDTDLSLLCFRARERWQDKFRYACRIMFSPTLGDWTSLVLPAYLLPLYYLCRPVRLVGKFLLVPLKYVLVREH